MKTSTVMKIEKNIPDIAMLFKMKMINRVSRAGLTIVPMVPWHGAPAIDAVFFMGFAVNVVKCHSYGLVMSVQVSDAKGVQW
jgi:hypothetical protein